MEMFYILRYIIYIFIQYSLSFNDLYNIFYYIIYIYIYINFYIYDNIDIIKKLYILKHENLDIHIFINYKF